jgi:hypothetical protein
MAGIILRRGEPLRCTHAADCRLSKKSFKRSSTATATTDAKDVFFYK